MVPPAIQTPIIQKWDELLNNLGELSTTTVKGYVEQSRRVIQLEEELHVWKQARSVALEKAEREKTQHETEAKEIQKRISVLESMQGSMVLCILDGDGNIFADHLVGAGLEGGREAARTLTGGVWKYLKDNGHEGHSRCTFWLSIYFNKKGLQDTLVKSGVCSADQFEAFTVGISQASPRFQVIDVGHGKEAADSKIKEHLQAYTRFPQTLKVFFGGGHDNGYLPTLAALGNERLLQKIVLLKGYRDIATELKPLKLQTLDIDNLFRSAKLAVSPISRLVPLSPASVSDITMSPPGLHLSGLFVNGNSTVLNDATPATKKQIDPSLPLSKQNPPPCNEFYLINKCPRGEKCKYGHDYELTPEHVSEVRACAKRAPCFSARKNGLTCSFGPNCIWGHTCPRGPECFYYKQGKCRFVRDDAHLQEAGGTSVQSPGGASHSPSAFFQSQSRSLVDQPPGVPASDGSVSPSAGQWDFSSFLGRLEGLGPDIN